MGKNNFKKCFIIAEAGVNHNGSLDLAKKLVDAAKNTGADAIKFQIFKSEDLVTKESKTADYQKKNTGKNETQLEMLKKLELSSSDFKELKKYCDSKKIIFLSSPHTGDAIDFLDPLVKIYKIGSGDLNNLPFLARVAKKKKPIILSTGMSNLSEVLEAIKTIKKVGNKKISLLHCTTSYPCDFKDVNLKAIETLKNKFNLPVGYSDHTLGLNVAIAAVALGAEIVEKHITLDKDMPGPDHKSSLEPDEFKKMVEGIRNIEIAMGDGVKKPTASEKSVKKFVRKSIVAKKDILKGEIIREDVLAIKRPGTGIEPKYLSRIIGKRAKRNIKEDELISWRNL